MLLLFLPVQLLALEKENELKFGKYRNIIFIGCQNNERSLNNTAYARPGVIYRLHTHVRVRGFAKKFLCILK